MKNLKKSAFAIALVAFALSFSLNLQAAPATSGNPVTDTTKMAKKKMEKMKMDKMKADKMKMKDGDKMKKDKMKMKKDSSKMGKM